MKADRILPAQWAWTTIGETMDVIRGGSPRPKGDPRYFGGDIPWIMISDVTRQPGKYLRTTRDTVTKAGAERSRLLPAGTLILSNSATVCVPKILAVPGCIHDGFVAFPRLPQHINIDYLYYYFEHIRPAIIQENRQGMTQVNLNTDIVRGIPIPLPPRGEQERIVAEIEKHFTRLDAAEAALKRVQANLKRYRASALKAAVEGRLVDTEPALAREASTASTLLGETQPLKQTMRKPRTHEPISPMKRLTPNGWTWATLGQCARRITDGTHQPPLFEDQGVPFVFVKHVVRGRLSFEGTKFISSDTFAALNRRCPVERGDILYTAVGSYGVAVLVDTDRPFSFQRHIAHIKLSTSLDAGYFVHCLNSPFVRQQADVVARGVAQKTVTLGDLTNFILPIPPLREQQRIRTELERRFSITETLEATTERLVHRARTMRQAILQAAFSGGLPGQRPVRRATLHDDSGVLGRPLAAAPLQDGV